MWNETFSSFATEIIRRKIRTFFKAHLDILASSSPPTAGTRYTNMEVRREISKTICLELVGVIYLLLFERISQENVRKKTKVLCCMYLDVEIYQHKIL